MSDEGQEFKIALAGSMPGELANGWDDDNLKDDLYKDRARVRYARVAYNVASAKEVTATGKRILTIGLVRVEPTDDDDAAVEEAEIIRLFEARTGQATLWQNSDTTDRDPAAGPYPGDPEWQEPA